MRPWHHLGARAWKKACRRLPKSHVLARCRGIQAGSLAHGSFQSQELGAVGATRLRVGGCKLREDLAATRDRGGCALEEALRGPSRELGGEPLRSSERMASQVLAELWRAQEEAVTVCPPASQPRDVLSKLSVCVSRSPDATYVPASQAWSAGGDVSRAKEVAETPKPAAFCMLFTKASFS